MKPVVLFLFKPRLELQEYLIRGVGERAELVFPESDDDPAIGLRAAEADVMVGWRPDDALLEKAERLRLFINPGAGVQHQIERFRTLNRTRRVALVNGHGNAGFTAQHIVAMLLCLTNRLIPHHNWMCDGRWRTGDRDAASIPLAGQTVGFVGFGVVNQGVHRRLSGFELSYLAFRRHPEKPHPAGIRTVRDPGTLFEESDIVIIAAPLTTHTRGMVGGAELAKLGRGGILINAGRGEIVKQEALFNALRDRTIAGAGLDVWYEYQPQPDDQGKRFPWHYPFHTLDNVVLSPHRAASPFSDLGRWDEVIENILRTADGRDDWLNQVDLDDEY